MLNKGDFITVCDTKDFLLSGKDFTMCGFIFTNEEGKLVIENCKGCSDWEKCKGFKKGN